MVPHAKEKKQRLDVLLTERGLAESRQKAQALILAGKVRVEGQRADKAGVLVPLTSAVSVEAGPPYVSRGGEKLAGALADFGIDCTGRICLDVGSSSGGFTDCLLQNGAVQVFAVDVTISQLHWKLQRDGRVIQIEANARYLESSALTLQPTLVTMDLSFISAAKVLPKIVPLAAPGADFLVLIKPQFELEREDVGRGGVVRDPALHHRAIDKVTDAARAAGLEILASKPSQLPGAEGNQEFFLWARLPPQR